MIRERVRDYTKNNMKPKDFNVNMCKICRYICLLLFAAPEKRQRVPSAYNRFIKYVIYFNYRF